MKYQQELPNIARQSTNPCLEPSMQRQVISANMFASQACPLYQRLRLPHRSVISIPRRSKRTTTTKHFRLRNTSPWQKHIRRLIFCPHQSTSQPRSSPMHKLQAPSRHRLSFSKNGWPEHGAHLTPRQPQLVQEVAPTQAGRNLASPVEVELVRRASDQHL